MKYVELYVKSLKSKQVQPIQAAPATINFDDLPGLKSHKQMDAEDKKKYKREYTVSLRQHQKMILDHNVAKGVRKKELKQALASQHDHLESMLLKIGTYSSTEKECGFEVPDAE
jgi:hypothetical protein